MTTHLHHIDGDPTNNDPANLRRVEGKRFPTWASALQLLLLAYTEGTPEGQRMAKAELQRMAEIADRARP